MHATVFGVWMYFFLLFQESGHLLEFVLYRINITIALLLVNVASSLHGITVSMQVHLKDYLND